MYLQSASRSRPITQRAAFPSLISHHFNVLLHVLLQPSLTLNQCWCRFTKNCLKIHCTPPPIHCSLHPSPSLCFLLASLPGNPHFFPSSVFHVAFPSIYSSMCGHTLSYFNFMCISTSHLPSTRCSLTDVSKSWIQRVSDFRLFSLFYLFFWFGWQHFSSFSW